MAKTSAVERNKKQIVQYGETNRTVVFETAFRDTIQTDQNADVVFNAGPYLAVGVGGKTKASVFGETGKKNSEYPQSTAVFKPEA